MIFFSVLINYTKMKSLAKILLCLTNQHAFKANENVLIN